MTLTPEQWGTLQRRKGGLRVLAVGTLALVAAAVAWLLSSAFGTTVITRLRFLAVGCAAVGIALVIGGAILLVRASRPPDPDQ